MQNHGMPKTNFWMLDLMARHERGETIIYFDVEYTSKEYTDRIMKSLGI
jgi:hypothetical protein